MADLHRHVDEARSVLWALGLQEEQTKDRAALTLLGLLHLTPDLM